MVAAHPAPDVEELSIDQLAVRAGLPSRTIREYQSMGLVPSPERRGRIGVYRLVHLHRLQLIGRLQERGYSLAGIGDLLARWHDGDDLTDILGLSPDELVHLDEPGAPATLAQLVRLLPSLVPTRLDDLLAVGVVDRIGPDRYCVPSPSLLQLTVDALDAGYAANQVLSLLTAVRDAAELVAKAAHELITHPPTGIDEERLEALVTRGRGAVAHGTGRMAIYALGRRLDGDAPGRRTRRAR